MALVKKVTLFIVYTFMFIMLVKREKVESRYDFFPRKNLIKQATVEASFAKLLKRFEEKLRLDQKLKHEEELEMKRNEIYRNLFLNRESGSFLNHF